MYEFIFCLFHSVVYRSYAFRDSLTIILRNDFCLDPINIGNDSCIMSNHGTGLNDTGHWLWLMHVP